MRIISNFKDYYDGFMVHDRKDPFVRVWVRNFTKDIEVSKYKLEAFDEKLFWFDFKHDRVFGKYLIVAGKVYPLVIKTVWNPYGVSGEEIYYNAEDLINSYKDMTPWGAENVRKFFKEYPDMTDLCLELKTPLILITEEDLFWDRSSSTFRKVSINPNLKELQFNKVMGSAQLYQTLDYFVSNIMVDDKSPHGVQTDIEKVEAHGFDKVKSFRKMPRD